MSYLLDTNVISELARTHPDQRLVAWFRNVPDEALHLSVLTLGEVRKGIEQVTPGAKREKLRIWLENELPTWFGDRVLGIDRAVADRWGRLLAEVGRTVPAIDSLLAATALHYELRLVTRNTADFHFSGLDVVNPWDR